MRIKIKKLSVKAIIPTIGSVSAAGSDLCACLDSDVVIQAGGTVKVPTGLAIAVPDGYAGFIYARSGLATKNGIRPANAVGLCDSDYRGEYIVALHNDSQKAFIVKHGDRIAQLVVAPVMQVRFEEVDELTETIRGEGGFGSTGK